MQTEPTLDHLTLKIPGRSESMGGIPLKMTFINGIMNSAADVDESAQMVSEFFHGTELNYVADPSRGLLGDLGTCLVYGLKGAPSESARRLAGLWRRLISAGAEVILHIAHSRGGMVTKDAVQLLPERDRWRIVVHNFGSPTDNPNATNHISKNDIIPKLLYTFRAVSPGGPRRDPNRVISYSCHNPSLLRSIGCDHLLFDPTYAKALHELSSHILEGTDAWAYTA